MRNLLALVGLLVIGFAVVGWYRGWYDIHPSTPGSGHGSYHIDLNTPKISEDLNKGREKLRDILTRDTDTHSTTVTPGSTNPGPGSAEMSTYDITDDGAFIYPGAEESSVPPTRPAPKK